jgi:hypothetical protein
MRTIKFRGKRIKDGKWIYGNIANYSSNFCSLNINKLVIFENIASFTTDNFGFVVNDCEVANNTVGQLGQNLMSFQRSFIMYRYQPY